MTQQQPQLDPDEVRFFSGRSNRPLAQGIANFLGIPLAKTNFGKYTNDTLHVQLGASVRGRAVYIVQSLVPPVSDHLLELLMMLDIAKGAAARQVHAIIPYFSYARSDKKDAPRISITARLIADLLKEAGATHVMTMTLHSPQVHGFFSVPTDPLTARGLLAQYFYEQQIADETTIMVAPDAGAAKTAGRLADQLGLPVATALKTRVSDTTVRISNQIKRQVDGYRRAIVHDDEIATGGTMAELCRMIVSAGIEEIYIACTHGLFLGKAPERLAAVAEIKEIVTTDTVPLPPERRLPNMTILSTAPVFGGAILQNATRRSIGDLFTFWEGEEEE